MQAPIRPRQRLQVSAVRRSDGADNRQAEPLPVALPRARAAARTKPLERRE